MEAVERPYLICALIPVPMKGTIHADATIHSLVSYFNPRTHEGYDGNQYYYLSRLSCFNPHTHEGYDQTLLLFRQRV